MITASFLAKVLRNSLLVFCVVFLSVSCGSGPFSNHLKEIPSNSFASEPLKKWGAPFTGIWQDSRLEKYRGSFSKMYIAPVSLDHVQSSRMDADDLAKYKEFGRYLDAELAKDLKKEGMSVVSSPKEANLILELALVKVEPTKAIYHYFSLGTSFFVPYVGSLISMKAKGEMVLMGKIVEAKTKKTLVVFGDYRGDEPTAFGSLRDYTRYGHHYQTLDMWSDRIVALLKSRGNSKVKAPIWFTLSPF